MNYETLTDRQRAFLMTSLLHDRQNSGELLNFLSPQEKSKIGPAMEEMLAMSKEQKRTIILHSVKQLSSQSYGSPLRDIHSDWILQALTHESPRIIATILRHLPTDHVRYVLERLPAKILQKMPPLSETFSLNPELIQILRRRFEKNFLVKPMPLTHRLTFSNLCLLTSDQLHLLFRKMGMMEVIMAFSQLDQKTMDTLFKRLPQRDATLLKLGLGKKQVFPEQRQKQAQAHLMSIDVTKGAPEYFILEVGFFLYSKALLPVYLEEARLIQQKFSLEVGRLLKKYIEKNLPLNSEKTVDKYQKEFLEMAVHLTEER